MARNLLTLIIFALAGFASAKKATFVPRSSVNKALSVRGGDQRLDPTDTAKIGMILAGGHAALTLMSPSRMAEVYGTVNTPVTEFVAQWQGSIILGFCLQAWELIVKGSDLKASIAAAALPTTIMVYKTLWNEDHKKLGYKLVPQLLWAVLGPLTIYACRTDASYADALIKFCAIWGLANGLLSTFQPEVSADGFGIPMTPEAKASYKTMGWVLLGSSIFQVLSVYCDDMSPIKAFGYSWIPALLMQISNNFITKESVAKAPSYVWMLVDVIVIAVCGFDSGGEHHDIKTTL